MTQYTGMKTTIKIDTKTKQRLDKLRENIDESYENIIRKLLWILGTCKGNPLLAKKRLFQIEIARRKIRASKIHSNEEMRDRFNV